MEPALQVSPSAWPKELPADSDSTKSLPVKLSGFGNDTWADANMKEVRGWLREQCKAKPWC